VLRKHELGYQAQRLVLFATNVGFFNRLQKREKICSVCVKWLRSPYAFL
jgi:hypothetical protein